MFLFWEVSLEPGLPSFWGFKPFLMRYFLNDCYCGSFRRLTMCSTISDVILVGMPGSSPRASTTFNECDAELTRRSDSGVARESISWCVLGKLRSLRRWPTKDGRSRTPSLYLVLISVQSFRELFNGVRYHWFRSGCCIIKIWVKSIPNP
jgi:hypothetical protein